MISDTEKLRLSEKVGYGFGDVASCFFWQTFAAYLASFYTDIFGLSAAAVATMLLATRSWDMGYDLVMGVIADRTTTRWGKFRPYLLWIPIPLGIVTILTFTTPDLSATGKLVYAYITYGALMLLYSSVNVPYAALLGVMTSRTDDRTSLSSYRMIGANLGSMFVSYSNYGLAFYFSVKDSELGDAMRMTVTAVTRLFDSAALPASELFPMSVITPGGYRSAIIVYVILATLFFFATFRLTKERIVPMSQRKMSWKQDFADLFRNKPWVMLVVVTIFKQVFSGVRVTMSIYYFKYYVQNEPLNGAFLLVAGLSNIVGIYLVQFLVPKFGKKVPYVVSIFLAAIFCALSFTPGPQDYAAIFTYQVLANIFMGPPTSMLWSLYADTADYSELKTGRRATGLIFSASGMCQKLGWTVASSAGLYILAHYGFMANVQQTPETLTGIRLSLSIYPALFCVAAGVVMVFYPLNEKRVREIEAALHARRVQAEAK